MNIFLRILSYLQEVGILLIVLSVFLPWIIDDPCPQPLLPIKMKISYYSLASVVYLCSRLKFPDWRLKIPYFTCVLTTLFGFFVALLSLEGIGLELAGTRCGGITSADISVKPEIGMKYAVLGGIFLMVGILISGISQIIEAKRARELSDSP